MFNSWFLKLYSNSHMMKIFQKNQTAAMNEHALEDVCINLSDSESEDAR